MSFEKYIAEKPEEIKEESEKFYEKLGKAIGLEVPTEPVELKESLSMEEVLTIVYIVVDDAYKKLFGSQAYFRTSQNDEPVFTDSEVITIALVAELAGYKSRNAWYNQVKKNYRKLFPDLCDRTRFVRRLSKLTQAMEQIRQHMLFLMNVDLSRVRVVDSFPVEVCHLRRVSSSTQPFEYMASFGYCASKKEHFYGFKVHMVTDTNGIPIAYTLSSAHVHDTKGLAFLLQDMNVLDRLLPELISIFGDKGYVGVDFAKNIKLLFGVDLLAISRDYDKDFPLPTSAYNDLVSKGRKIIETTISVFTGSMNAASTKARSISGFLTNLVSKFTAFNLANYINLLLAQPPLQISSIVN
ncbi:MAG: IS982 family transposase [Blastocatellia bacterium]